MKNVVTTAVVLLLLVGLLPYVPKVKASGTLADTMNTIITANSWVPTSSDAAAELSSNVAHYATVFSVGNPSYYQTAAQNDLASGTPVQVLHDKRMAEIDGMPLAVSDATVQSYLSSAAMVGYVPVTMIGYFCIYHRFEAHAYDWAPSSLASKWDRAAALSQMNMIVQAGNGTVPQPYLWYGPTSGDFPGGRYYDEWAETLEWFLEVGGNSYMSTCDQFWAQLQKFHWNDLYYGYKDKTTMETEVGPFAIISGRYLVTQGLLGTYGSRIVSDLNQKLLISGYSSPLWNSYSLDHVPGRGERRLENAASAWAAMHAYYPLMTPVMQSTLQGMGSVGWRGLLDESGNFHPSNNMFSYHATSAANMGSTGIGLMVLFMNGIVPKTGSLAVPLNDEYYEDAAGWSPATMFRFDYANRQIRIPVNAGTLNFIFGSGTASYTFPSTGVYQVQFSSDWNTVQSASRMGPLDSGFKYITAGSSPPPPTYTVTVLTKDSSGTEFSGATVTLGSQSKTSGSAIFSGLSPGYYTISVPTTYGSMTFSHWEDASTSATRNSYYVGSTSTVTLTATYVGSSPPDNSSRPPWWPSFLSWPPAIAEIAFMGLVGSAPIGILVAYVREYQKVALKPLAKIHKRRNRHH
jgi:hypothetical protein